MVMYICLALSTFQVLLYLGYILLSVWAGYLSCCSDWLQAGRSGDGIPRFSASVQTRLVAHPAPCTKDTRSFPGVKSCQGVTLIPHPLLVPWSRKSRAIPLFPLWAIQPVQSLTACTRVHFTLPLPVVLQRLKLDGQTQYLNVKLSVM